ncbi:MAG TPA: hypothetical protein VNG53_01005 [Bacteroidia bacterium]|nr:hypothetical protein [Bacteroidia bacterium]
MEVVENNPLEIIEPKEEDQYQGCFFKTAIIGCFSLVAIAFLWLFFLLIGFIFWKH